MPVIKGTGYALVHAPNLLLHNGVTQVLERYTAPDSDYLKILPKHLRSFEQAVSYAPNQAYIGNLKIDELSKIKRPWYENSFKGQRSGKYGEILSEDEFYGLLKIVDAFDLVVLEESFMQEVKEKLSKIELFTKEHLEKLVNAKKMTEIQKMVDDGHKAIGLYLGERLVGCVRQAHEIDENLSAHVILENLVVKASGVLGVLCLLKQSGMAAKAVDYIIECSEEACGDMNQRGGGNFAKAIGEVAGLVNATGSDIRGFCAGPSHAVLQAAALVKSEVFENVIVVGGGAVAKLGMNAKDHVKKGMPVLEDMLGVFALMISKDDGVNPVIRLDVIGKHNISSGAAPQQVMKALVSDPLGKMGMKIEDIDYYSVEMQNPELTEPAGAGNVPEANYKMIGALAVMNKEIERKDLMNFVEKHGLIGFAPTQGHIPSGVPTLGYLREEMLQGKIKNAMIIGKGSLFLARMTNLFDGLSLVVEKNNGQGIKEKVKETSITQDEVKKMVALALRDMAKTLA